MDPLCEISLGNGLLDRSFDAPEIGRFRRGIAAVEKDSCEAMRLTDRVFSVHGNEI